MFRLAHFSDVHLAPMPRVRLAELGSKRLIGYHAWRYRRRRIHDRAVADLVVDDIRASGADHAALTGDLVNIALGAEFAQAAAWLADVADPAWLTFVPGNHDAYVATAWEHGLGRWGAYMTGDLAIQATADGSAGRPFPFVRQRRNIALVGVSTAVPTAPGQATGRVGPHQMAALAATLRELRLRGFYRIVLIHHPPLPGLARPSKRLLDADDLRRLLEEEGADLVLHGHNHQSMYSRLASRHGPVHIFGVPSASSNGWGHVEPAGWNLYAVRRSRGAWHCVVTSRSYDPARRAIATTTKFDLDGG